MALPVWVTGQVLSASDINTWFVPVAAYKTADTSRTSNTTLSNDPDLAVPYAANGIYLFHCYLLYTGAAGGDIKWTWTGLSGATLRYAPMRQNVAGSWAGAFADLGGGTENANGQGSGTLMNAVLFGTLFAGASAGTMQLQWAQDTSSGTPTVLKAQSCVYLQRMG